MARPKKKLAPDLEKIAAKLESTGDTEEADNLRAFFARERGRNLNIEKQFKSQLEKYHAEKHYWITFNHTGEGDQVDTVHIGAAGVSYNIRKGQRVLLPQSAINVLKNAVTIMPDLTRPPQFINGVKYFEKSIQSEYSYNIDGEVSPEEAAEWRKEQEKQRLVAEGMVAANVQHADLIRAGT